MATYRIKLTMKTAFTSVIDNIKLFNALFLALSMIDNEKAKSFKNKVEKNQIVFSSAFPYENDEYYIPFPISLKAEILKELEEDKENGSLKINRKAVKKNNFISLTFLKKIINLKGKERVKKLDEWISRGEEKGKSKRKSEGVELIRNTINKYDQTTNVFTTTYLGPKKLYFLVKCKEEDINSLIQPALNLLSKLGLGGDISIGRGVFEIIGEPEEIHLREKGNLLLLSKLIPKEEYLQNLPSDYYRVKEFKTINKTGNHIKGIMYFEEGSVFKREIEGRLIDKSDIKYFINGKPFFLPMEGLK